MNSGLNTFWLITLGAGFFALSFIRGRRGQLGQSLIFAALAGVSGCLKAVDDGVLEQSRVEALSVFCGYILLPLASVLVGRRLHQSERSQESE